MSYVDWTSVLKLSPLTLLAFVASSQVANAATFEGTASATFGTPTPDTGGVVFSGVGTNTFSSGSPVGLSTSNIFVVDGLAFSTVEDTPFAVANLTYTNGVTSNGTNIDFVPADLSLDFSTPSGVSEAFTFTFDLDVTPNTTGDPVLDADTLSVIDVFSTTSFEVAGELFTLELLGFSTDGGTVIDNVFTLPEDATTTSQLFARITAPPQGVPESSPAALVFLGLGAMFASKLPQRWVR